MVEPATRPATTDDPVLKAAVEAVRAHYGDRVESIVLFGSRARGDHGPESDYDVAVFLKDLERSYPEAVALGDRAWQVFEETGASVSLIPLSSEHRPGTALLRYDIAKDGIPLLGDLPEEFDDVTKDELDKADRILARAEKILTVGEPALAAREAYMAAFHAALAYLFERQKARPKTHSGLHSLFGEAARRDPDLGGDLGQFLARAFEFKQNNDYAVVEKTTAAEAEAALASATDFVARIKKALERPSSGRGRSAAPS